MGESSPRAVDLPHTVNDHFVPLIVAMCHVKPGDVHAIHGQLPEYLHALADGAYGANDFSLVLVWVPTCKNVGHILWARMQLDGEGNVHVQG
jgi:hypothetical protein